MTKLVFAWEKENKKLSEEKKTYILGFIIVLFIGVHFLKAKVKLVLTSCRGDITDNHLLTWTLQIVGRAQAYWPTCCHATWQDQIGTTWPNPTIAGHHVRCRAIRDHATWPNHLVPRGQIIGFPCTIPLYLCMTTSHGKTKLVPCGHTNQSVLVCLWFHYSSWSWPDLTAQLTQRALCIFGH